MRNQLYQMMVSTCVSAVYTKSSEAKDLMVVLHHRLSSMLPDVTSSGSAVGLSMNPNLMILVFYHFLQDYYLNHCIYPEEVASSIILSAAHQNQYCDKSLINSFAWQNLL